MKSVFKNFVNMYSVNKTLKFALKPVGDTGKNIKNKHFLTKDKHLAEKYKKAKKIIDEYHKQHIERTLSGFSFKTEDIEAFIHLHKNLKKELDSKNKTSKTTNDLRKKIEKLQKKLRMEVSKTLSRKDLFKKKFITKILPEWLKNNFVEIEGIEKPKEIIDDFAKRATYFKGFSENRKNIYTSEAHSTAIGFRIIHENLPKFVHNMNRYKKAKQLEMDFKQIEESLDVDLNKVFSVEGFNKCLTQKGIEKYNLILGGKTEQGNKKIQGVNEIINLFSQQLAEKQDIKNAKSCRMEQLYKQILSDTNTQSFVLDEISNDAELCKLIKQNYHKKNNKLVIRNLDNEEISIEDEIMKIFSKLQDADIKQIYLKASEISNISKNIFGDWSVIRNSLDIYVKECIHPLTEGKKETKKLQKDREKWLKQDYFSLYDIHSSLEHYSKQNEDAKYNGKSIQNYFSDLKIKLQDKENLIPIFPHINDKYKNTLSVLDKYSKEKREELKKDEISIQSVKEFLDSIMALQQFLKPLYINIRKAKQDSSFNTLEKDDFYIDFEPLFESISQVVPIYNKVRNYLTKKQFSIEKYKLNFENQTLANGWDKNKETDNTCVILLKNNKYYLGIMDNSKQGKKIFTDKVLKYHKTVQPECSSYKKMEYKLLPGPNKMLPKVFFSKKGLSEYNPSNEIIEINNYSSHTKNGKPKEGFDKKEFSKEDMHKIIDFFRDSIDKHPDWSKFDFKFSQTVDYKEISDFYREVEHQGYKIDFRDISEEYINKCVEEEKLYLFEIYSKDFSKKTRGKPNLQTIYWKLLFDSKNLADVVYKLDGKAELFHRPASLKYDDKVWKEGHHAKDPKKKQKYPIIKDHRYAVDTYLFHVPITCNFKADNKKGKFNQTVNNVLKNNSNVNVIGIDRGERHLAYYTVINQKGEILEQDSLNNPLKDTKPKDYQKLLDKKEKARDEARKSWGTIGQIKDLKSGYLSQVVHKLVKLMIKHNAIIVFEDLNFEFKKGRFKVEKQVYQKLEKSLIDKLNYLVIKDKSENDLGGSMKALQLTEKFSSFKKMDKQTGFIFYVPAYHTSKVCPMTGFINLLYPRYETIQKSQDFFSRFDKICFKDGIFEFHLDYTKFNNKAEDHRKKWIVCSHGKRLKKIKNKNNKWDTEEVDLTPGLKNLFESNKITIDDGVCLKDQICRQDKSDFFRKLVSLLKLTLQMRNSKIGTDEDWLISPVRDTYGKFFDSRNANDKYPKDADANGAYHIALKGLLMLEQLKDTDDISKLQPIKNETWHSFLKNRKAKLKMIA